MLLFTWAVWQYGAFKGLCLPSKWAQIPWFLMHLALASWPFVSKKKKRTKPTTHVKWTPIFKWYVIRWQFNIVHKKGTYLEYIGPCAQKMLTVLCSVVNMVEGDL